MEVLTELKSLLKKVRLENEFDLERASLLDRKLRLMAKSDPKYAADRVQIRKLIKAYEEKRWSKSARITDEQIKESDLAEKIAEAERKFYEARKKAIKQKIKELGLTQKQLGFLLGHSDSYMSELMNGISPFSIKDLTVLNSILKIELEKLVPTILSYEKRKILVRNIAVINNPKLKLSQKTLLPV